MLIFRKKISFKKLFLNYKNTQKRTPFSLKRILEGQNCALLKRMEFVVWRGWRGWTPGPCGAAGCHRLGRADWHTRRKCRNQSVRRFK